MGNEADRSRIEPTQAQKSTAHDLFSVLHLMSVTYRVGEYTTADSTSSLIQQQTALGQVINRAYINFPGTSPAKFYDIVSPISSNQSTVVIPDFVNLVEEWRKADPEKREQMRQQYGLQDDEFEILEIGYDEYKKEVRETTKKAEVRDRQKVSDNPLVELAFASKGQEEELTRQLVANPEVLYKATNNAVVSVVSSQPLVNSFLESGEYQALMKSESHFSRVIGTAIAVLDIINRLKNHSEVTSAEIESITQILTEYTTDPKKNAIDPQRQMYLKGLIKALEIIFKERTLPKLEDASSDTPDT